MCPQLPAPFSQYRLRPSRPPFYLEFPYENAASLLLGLTYEIRRAESGDRELYTMYNGLTSDFLAPAGTPDEQIMSLEEYRKCQDRFDAYDDIIYMDIDMDLDTAEPL